jgi:ABC-2 type transport system permease protein
LIVLALSLLIAGVSLYSALGGIVQATTEAGTSGFIFLRLFTTSSGNVPAFVSFIALVGPLIGLILGFDAINSERSAGTLNRLLAQPIHRDDVINGKFVAGVCVISIVVISMVMLIAGVGLLRIGIPPTGEEVVRIIVFVIFTIVYISFWLGLSILLSVVSRHAATSALSVVAVWLIMGFFISLIATGLAGAIYPDVASGTNVEAAEGYLAFQQSFSRISPSVLYTEATATMLNPGMRMLGITTVAQMEQLQGAVVGTLPLGQSLLLVWPHLIGIIAEMVTAFVASYIIFMKQEIRGA